VDITLTIAVLGAAISAVGWVANYIFSTAADKHRQRLASQLEFTKQQLEELYGPLAFLILESNQSFRDLLEVLGRNYVFVNGYISEDDLKTWLFWVENDLFPRHRKIRDLLSSKTHLIEGKKISPSILAYLNHIQSWIINHERWQKQGVPYSWHSKVNYPREFAQEILSTFEDLKQQHSKLLGKVLKKHAHEA
jgi:hypothetical protein